MTAEVKAFVRSLGLQGRCLDVGAFDVNGSVRDLFPDYVGMDMRAGPGVDIVASAHYMPFPDAAFDVVCCLEMLEHDADPFASLREMWRVLRHGGALVVTVPGIGFPRHDYPSDYWRFTGDGVRVLLAWFERVDVREDRDHVYAVGYKGATCG